MQWNEANCASHVALPAVIDRQKAFLSSYHWQITVCFSLSTSIHRMNMCYNDTVAPSPLSIKENEIVTRLSSTGEKIILFFSMRGKCTQILSVHRLHTRLSDLE